MLAKIRESIATHRQIKQSGKRKKEDRAVKVKTHEVYRKLNGSAESSLRDDQVGLLIRALLV